jgi:hypothetical protein
MQMRHFRSPAEVLDLAWATATRLDFKPVQKACRD